MFNLELIMQIGLNVNLCTLLEGIHLNIIEPKEIIDFALSKLEEDPENVNLCLLEIACLDHEDLRVIEDILTRFINKQKGLNQEDLDKEKEKWVIVLSKKMMDNLPKDPMEAILEIGSFWNEWEYPVKDIVDRSYGNDPRTYFTEENLKELQNRYYLWFNQQIENLQKAHENGKNVSE